MLAITITTAMTVNKKKMKTKPKPGDRIKITSGKYEGRIGVYRRHTDNGEANQGYVLLMGEANDRRLWISSMKVSNEATAMEMNEARRIATLASEMAQLSLDEITTKGRWKYWTNNPHNPEKQSED